jgi:hypothetical protein
MTHVDNVTDFAAGARKLADYCAAHPNVRSIAATDKLFEQD